MAEQGRNPPRDRAGEASEDEIRVCHPDHAEAYRSPVPVPVRTQHDTMEVETVVLAPAINPALARTMRMKTVPRRAVPPKVQRWQKALPWLGAGAVLTGFALLLVLERAATESGETTERAQPVPVRAVVSRPALPALAREVTPPPARNDKEEAPAGNVATEASAKPVVKSVSTADAPAASEEASPTPTRKPWVTDEPKKAWLK